MSVLMAAHMENTVWDVRAINLLSQNDWLIVDLLIDGLIACSAAWLFAIVWFLIA